MIICKVCGERVAEQVACCARCFTPHHFDCWSFAGQCSIYGCGSTEHQYFDFAGKSEAEVLASIGRSLALAIRESCPDASARSQEPARTPRSAASRPGREAGSGQPVLGSAGELLAYKLALYRSLHAVLQKAAPAQAVAVEEDLPALEEADGSPRVPALFIADSFSVDSGERGRTDLEEKRRLLRSMAQRPEIQEPPGLLERAVAALRELLRRLSS